MIVKLQVLPSNVVFSDIQSLAFVTFTSLPTKYHRNIQKKLQSVGPDYCSQRRIPTVP